MKLDNFSLWSGVVQDVPGKVIVLSMAKLSPHAQSMAKPPTYAL